MASCNDGLLRRTVASFLIILSIFHHSVLSMECNKFRQSCFGDIGTYVTQNGNADIPLQANGAFYFTLQLPDKASDVKVASTVFFGDIAYYVTVDREPKINDFDFVTDARGLSTLIPKAFVGSHLGATANILVRPLAKSLFRCMPLATATVPKLALGVPFEFKLNRAAKFGASRMFFFTPSTTGTHDVTLTPLSGIDSASFLVIAPKNSSDEDASRVWKSFGDDPEDSFNDNGIVSFDPLDYEVSNAFHVVVWLTPSSNASDLVLTVADTSSSETPVQLLAGTPMNSYVGLNSEKYFSLRTQPGLAKDVSISINAITGDPDIYVNPGNRGFYHRSSIYTAHPDPAASWSSTMPGGLSDSLVISHTDDLFTSSQGTFLISVFGFEASDFSITASQGSSMQIVMEGVAVHGSVDYGDYVYFQFLDGQPAEDLEIDLQPSSGDADLFVSCISDPNGLDSGYPSRIHYNYSSTKYMEDSLWIRADDRNSCSKNGGIFYIAVYGYSYYATVTFSLQITHYGGTKVISIGKAASDSVFKGIGASYKFRVGFEASTVTVSLQTITGDADLYVKLGSGASTNSYDYSSTKVGTVIDFVTIPESNSCADCWVSIFVLGYQTSTFSLLVTLEDTVVQLVDSKPSIGSVAQGEFQFYTVIAPVSGKASAVLTVFSGSPNLFISLTNEEPIAESTDVIACDSDSTGNLPVVSIDNVYAGQVIYVGVGGGETNSSYTIRVAVDGRSISPNALPPIYSIMTGLPQSDTIGSSSNSIRYMDWKFYILPVPAGHESLTIRGTRLIGEADFYVSRCPYSSAADCATMLPNQSHYIATTRDLSDDVITISRQDDNPCSYLVGIQSMSMFTAYQVSESIEHSVLALQAGISVTDHVDVDEIDYYSFYLGDELEARFILTKVSGDPDIFVTTNSSTLVSEANALWKSTNWGSDVIDINPRSDDKACAACIYYIAIIGASESTYRLTAATASNVPVLTDGMPLNDRVPAMGWNFYTFFNPYGVSRDIKLTLTSVTGDADLYVTLDGSKPSYFNNAYNSVNFFTSDEVRIDHNDASFAPCIRSSTNSGCQIRIGISGLFVTSEYNLVLTSSLSATLLSLGLPSTGTIVEDTYESYRVISNAGSDDVDSRYSLQISLTVYSGSVNAYISCGNSVNLPNMTSHAWRIESPDNILSIESVDMMEHGCTSADASIGASLYISLFGLQSSSYSLTTAMELDSSMTMLVSGIPTSSVVAYKGFKYFLIRPGYSYQNIKLVLTVEQGDSDIYVSESWTNRPKFDESKGRVTSFILASASFGSDILTISHKWISATCSRNHPANQCYLVVGIYGSFNANTPTSYTLVSTFEDSTLQIANGVPVRGQVGSRDMEYYKYTLSEPNVDIAITLTPFSGDADLFVSMAPIYHPSAVNSSWFAAAYGDDTLIIQAEEYSSKCTPDPNTGRHCDFYIGVYGFANATFSLMVSMDTGFVNPVLLIDGQPQAGHILASRYAYYRYRVSGGDANNLIPSAITFTLTPTDDNDVDLFVTVEGHGEPGRDHNDYSSINWGSNVDQVQIKPGDQNFCISCTMYIAVWGYEESSFSLVATSQGMTQLQMGRAIGGHSDTNSFQYYTVYLTDPFATLSIVLTSMTGDADLYINTYVKSSTGKSDFKLPTREQSIWHAVYYGDDTINIDYTSENFCFNCVYIIGVYGYRNASFTLLATESEDTVIRLVTNRPQIASLADLGDIRYFTTSLHTSADDITFSLTSLDTGYADMFVQVYNQSFYETCVRTGKLKLPDPHDSSTYMATTFYDESSMLYIRGPHSSSTVFVVAVFALSAVRFSIVATLSSSPITLQAGVPQSHYVAKDSTVLFEYYPSDDSNILISLTARSGDPDLFVSTGKTPPSCTVGQWGLSMCGNYTWSSRMYSTDQIFLSIDEPCSAMLPSTVVSSTCDEDTSYVASSSVPVNILVQGFRESQFSISVSPSGGLRHLLAGQPQLSLATPAVICKDRGSSGSCIKSSNNQVMKVLISTFAFQVSTPSSSVANSGNVPAYVGDVLVSVLPQCANATSAVCLPGCACNPLQVYATSCATSKCTVQHRHPSFINNNFKASVGAVDSSLGSTLIMPTSGEGNCDPMEVGEGCVYFISVIAEYNSDTSTYSRVNDYGNLLSQQAAFTIFARTPFDIALVPCSSVHSFSDGTKQDSLDYIRDGAETSRNYEICSSTDTSDIIVSLEQCTGFTKLYACDEHCTSPIPDSSNWAYYSDSSTTCAKRWVSYGNNNGWGKSDCKPTSSHTHSATITLPAMNSNYFLTADGPGKFRFRVESTQNGNRLAPSVLPMGGMGSEWDGDVKLYTASGAGSAVIGNSVRLSWTPAQVLLPGARSLVFAEYMTYHAFVVDIEALQATKFSVDEVPVLNTMCGLSSLLDASDNMKQDLKFAMKVVFSPKPSDQDSEFITRRLSKLFPSRILNITFVAVCDSVCLHLVSKSEGLTHVCLKDTDCFPQYLVYPPFQVETGEAITDTDSSDAGDSSVDDSTLSAVLYVGIIVTVAIIIISGLFYMSYAKTEAATVDSDGIQLHDYSTSEQREDGDGQAASTSKPSQTGYVPPSAFGFDLSDSNTSSGERMKRLVGDVGNQMIGAIGSVTSRVSNSLGSKNPNQKTKFVGKRVGKSAYSPLDMSSSHGGNNSAEQDDDDEEISISL